MTINKKKKVKKIKKPIVFISYSWDSEPHKKWVKNLADKLIQNGVNVILDQYELFTGMHKSNFMEHSIKKAKKVILVLTPNYAKKAEKLKGGVGHEYSIINSEISDNITQNKKYIPILRSGNEKKSCPEFLRQLIHSDMRKRNSLTNEFDKLLDDIFENRPTKPPFGDIPERFINKRIKDNKDGRKR